MSAGIPYLTDENMIRHVYEYAKDADKKGSIFNAKTERIEPFSLANEEFLSFFVHACDDYIKIFPGADFPKHHESLRLDHVLVELLADHYIKNTEKTHLKKYAKAKLCNDMGM